MRDKTIVFRLSDQLQELLDLDSKYLGLSRPEYLRSLIMFLSGVGLTDAEKNQVRSMFQSVIKSVMDMGLRP